ncbi:MAG: CxxC-x17-CxxC domain-containing protein [Nanoarchaeota archaeon]
MGFDRGNNRGGFNAGRGRDNFRSNDRGFSRDRPQRREMFDVQCTKCGKDARVPFKPTGNKPVLCSDCFSKDGGDRRGNGSGSVDLTEINAKLDKIIKILGELELDVEADESDENSDDSDEEEIN